MSVSAMNWCYAHSPFRGAHGKFVCHLTVANVVNEQHDFEFWMSQTRLAELAGVSRRTTNEFFAEAVEMGLLVLVEDNGTARKPNRYQWPTVALAATLAAPHSSGEHEQPLHMTCATAAHDMRNGCASHEQPLLTIRKETKEEPKRTSDAISTPSETVPSVLLDPPTPLDREARKRAERASQIRDVFDAWVRITERSPNRTKLNTARRQKINARLSEGYTVQDCIDAFGGVVLSPFHMGDNQERKRWDDIVIVLRDGAQVEKFRGLFDCGGAEGHKTDVVDRVFAKIEQGGGW